MFYGFFYGGKSVMRIFVFVIDYCLLICFVDFNEWVWKNVFMSSLYSYVWIGEYEIFEFNLGSIFNYVEMFVLIVFCLFMVEWGYFDGVFFDEVVVYEFVKVRYFYFV